MSEKEGPLVLPSEWRSLDGMAKANLSGPMLGDWFKQRDSLYAAGREWPVAKEELLAYFMDSWEEP